MTQTPTRLPLGYDTSAIPKVDTGRSGAQMIYLILVYFYLSIADTETLTLVGDEMIKREI